MSTWKLYLGFDKHSEEIETAHAKTADLHSALESCADKDHHMSLKTCPVYIEVLMGDLVDSHANEIEAVEEKMVDLHVALESRANEDLSLETRLGYIKC